MIEKWCFECTKKHRLEPAVKMVLVSEFQGKLREDGLTIDNRKVPLCLKCYGKKSDFQKKHCDRVEPFNIQL